MSENIKHSKLTLIVDGNWLFMSRLAVLVERIKNVSNLCDELELLMIKSIRRVLRNFPDIDNIVFVSDGGSWRKNIDVSTIENELLKLGIVDVVGYKETRVHDDLLNWEYMFSRFDDFQNILQKNGITTSQEHYVEGDDWVWYWSTILNNNNTNCIIWSKDNDLKQLIKTDSNSCFTVWWNADNGLFIDDAEESDMNWFFNIAYSDNCKILNNVKKKSKKITIIDPHEIIINKIFMGDLGDNVLPIALRHAKNSESDKKFKISKKDIPYDIDILNENDIREYFNNLLTKKSYVGRVINDNIDVIMKHFDINRQMIWLHESQYPQEILDTMRQHRLSSISSDIDIVESAIQSRVNEIDDVLENI